MPFNGVGVLRKIDMFFNIIVPFYIVTFECDDKEVIANFLRKVVECYPPTGEMKKNCPEIR